MALRGNPRNSLAFVTTLALIIDPRGESRVVLKIPLIGAERDQLRSLWSQNQALRHS